MINRFKNFLQKVLHVIQRPEMAVLPGQLAFFFVLSVVPIVTLITYGASFLHLSMDFIADFITKAFGGEVAGLVIPMVAVSNIDFRFFFTLIVGFYIASNGAASIIVSSNAIYGIPDTSFLRRRTKAVIMTFLIVILFIFILMIILIYQRIIAFATAVSPNKVIL